jgi:hypothetical protein
VRLVGILSEQLIARRVTTDVIGGFATTALAPRRAAHVDPMIALRTSDSPDSGNGR